MGGIICNELVLVLWKNINFRENYDKVIKVFVRGVSSFRTTLDECYVYVDSATHG